MPRHSGQVSAPPTHRLGSDAFGSSPETALWWLTNAGFLINCRGTLLMIDPAISLEAESPDVSETGMRLLIELPLLASEVPRLDAVLYSHFDEDHLAPVTARELASTEALFIGPPPVQRALIDLGVPEARTRVAAVGDTTEVGNARLGPTPADHPWQLRDPERLGSPWGPGDCCGYVIDTPDGRLWCPGDTRLMDEHLQMHSIDLLLLDVSRNEYHLGVENAARLASALEAPHIIPYHYGTYDAPDHSAYNGDPAEVAARIPHADRRMHLLAPGQKYVMGGERRVRPT